MKAQICPICLGKGLIPIDVLSTSTAEKSCHGCFGKGWVEVRE